jgi:hypothetical protein
MRQTCCPRPSQLRAGETNTPRERKPVKVRGSSHPHVGAEFEIISSFHDSSSALILDSSVEVAAITLARLHFRPAMPR